MKNIFLVLVSALSLSSCMFTKPRIPELPLPPQPLIHPIFTVLPPAEIGWVVANMSKQNLSLAKRGGAQDETYAIQVMLLQIPTFNNDEEFKSYIDKGLRADTNGERFKQLETEVITINSSYGNCIKNTSKTEDTKPRKISNKSGNMILENIHYTCKHPTISNGAANFSYSHRYYSGQEDLDFEKKADILFSNFKFNEK